ncbi:uncharacterized protein LOC126983985 [Eriocheir sinensis]|uniref:uncharacterized protein LOC126983985 n=1 Tax=Eriocheir sinensis TaxID=95602 RepID=UPI0021C97EC1|nr:uncharacterized protein LOC126983985 [Eriocheir sinensis]XP_050693236.1 uncharacterized protein LOC126983985 [Eriocheir sinensis]
MARRGDVCCMIIRCCVLLCCCPLRHGLGTPTHTSSTCLHHPSPADILQETVQEEDHEYDVKLLPADRQVSAFLQYDQTQRLVFPLAECGPITITVTPCDFPLSWTLTLRPHRCREERTPPPPRGKKIRAIVSSVGGRGAFHHRHRHNTITNVSYNSTKLLRRDGRNEFSSFRIWQQAASRPNDTTVPAGRLGVGAAAREEAVEEGQTQAAVVEEQYEGHEPRQFMRREAPAGLYVLQLHAGRGATHVHILVTCLWTPPSTTALVTATPAAHGRAITLHWPGGRSSGSGGYCLAVSEGRPFPSLCAARAALSHARHAEKWPRAILGCTDKPWYELPHAPRRALHVAVWEVGHAGPPLGTGLVPAMRSRRIPRLRPGALMRLTPSTVGTAVARFRVRRRGKRLHVIAVACGAKLRLKVMAPHGERLASATGNLGALHLAVKKRQTLPKVLVMRLITWPTGAASEVILTASYSARALSLPRLPRNARVRLRGITCTSATLRWSAARGSHAYCLLVKEDRSGKTWRTRPPRQCGWEAALKETNFAAKWCSEPTTAGRQERTLHALAPGTTYIATVLSRHPTTGRALSFTPARFTTLSPCPSAANTTTSPAASTTP